MNPTFLIIMVIFFAPIGGLAWSDQVNEKWEGYRPLAETDLPKNILDFAENSIFFIQSVDSSPNQTMEIVDLKVDARSKTIVTDKSVLTKDLYYFQIETCRKQDLRYCPIAKSFSVGTAFFNQDRLYTCRHSFHNWLSFASEANNVPVDLLSPPLILRIPKKGQAGKFLVVYQSAFYRDQMVRFARINRDPVLNFQVDENDPTESARLEMMAAADFVEMSFPSTRSEHIVDYNLPIGSPTDTAVNKEVYTIGYPVKTNSPELGEGNAPGNELSATNGFIIGTYIRYGVTYSSNFTSEGISGAPVVSPDGHLLGMNCAGFDMHKANTQPEQVNAGFFPFSADGYVVKEGQ